MQLKNICASLSLLLILMPLAMAAEIWDPDAHDIETVKVLKTSMGTVSVHQSKYKKHTYSDQIWLNKTAVFKKARHNLGIGSKYTLGRQEVVLLVSKCGGNGCSSNRLLLVLEKGKKPNVLTADNFFSLTDHTEVEIKDAKLIIDLGYEGGKHKVARYDGAQLTIALEDVGRLPMSEKACQSVYEIVQGCLPGSCQEDQLPMSSARSLPTYLPGYVKQGFNTACGRVCRGEKVAFDKTFKQSVCSID